MKCSIEVGNRRSEVGQESGVRSQESGVRLLAAVLLAMAVVAFATVPSRGFAAEDALALKLRHQTETAPGSGRFHTLTRDEAWQPRETAIIVCDMWDLHHCLNAVRRETEFAPRLEQVLKSARERGVTIIHAPSGCMTFYADHPARVRAAQTPKSANLPTDIGKWCYSIPAEEQGVYPIDQKEGGEDDDPAEHAKWAKELEAKGLNPRAPWTRQTNLLSIDPEREYISDSGDEVWSILEQRGIQNVILTGVHTNMCVLGRPFGLRQLAKNGKNVVLMRDLTDTMYDPNKSPFVSHFTGTDLIVAHIEKYVCPTITSDQVLGGQPFRFSGDTRPHLVIVSAEDEYETETTLPPFALAHLGKDFRVSYVFANDADRADLPGVDVVADADVLLVSVRRRPLHAAQLELFRKHVAAGKPVVGLRTASHAFSLRNADRRTGRLEDLRPRRLRRQLHQSLRQRPQVHRQYGGRGRDPSDPGRRARDVPAGRLAVQDVAAQGRSDRAPDRPARRADLSRRAGRLDLHPRRRRPLVLHLARPQGRLRQPRLHEAAHQRPPLGRGIAQHSGALNESQHGGSRRANGSAGGR
jgi:nicotinamidase-related amidase